MFMKVLILSCEMGEGHNSAAKAVYEYFKKNNVECELLDALSLKSEKASKFASAAYLRVIKIPYLFGVIYAIGRLVSDLKIKSPVYYINRSYRQRLHDYINDGAFDAIITTHLFPAESLTALKREKALTALTIGVNTDYTCIPFWEETELDYYIIPHKDLIDEFAARGIPRNKLLPYGIPVRPEFYTRLTKQEARKKLCSLCNTRFDYSKPLYMIMSGSMGYGRIQRLVRAIIDRHADGVNLIVICGSNKRLKGKLELFCKAYENIAVCGYSRDIPLIMDASDLIFTKPGGLSSTEAAVKNIPIIHTAPIPGCENKNARFFSSRLMSCYSWRIKKQLVAAERICNDDFLRNKIIQAQRENIPRDTCENIYRLLAEPNRKEGMIP